MGGDVEERAVAERRLTSGRAGAFAADAPLVLYTGTFEAYQGVELLIDAAAHPRAHASRGARAGRRRRTRAGRGSARAGRSAGAARRDGRSPGSSRRARSRRSCEACDILVSPRIRGTNTPLKIYSYLRSGKPIVATDLLTHTQVLSPRVARLVPAEPGAVCRRDRRARSTGPRSGARLAAAAAALAATKYSREAYVRRTAEAYRAADGRRVGRTGCRRRTTVRARRQESVRDR